MPLLRRVRFQKCAYTMPFPLQLSSYQNVNFSTIPSPLINFYDRFQKKNAPPIEKHKIKSNSEILFGLHPVYLALKVSKREAYQIFIKDSIWNYPRESLRSRNPNMAGLLDLVESRKLTKNIVNLHLLSRLCNDRPHQGVALECSPTKAPVLCRQTLEEISNRMIHENNKSNIQIAVFFDEIKDVMNFGNVLRSAAFFSARTIFLPSTASSSPMPVISKISSGAMEVLDFYKVEDKLTILREFRARGFTIIGTSGQDIPRSITLDKLNGSKNFNPSSPTIVVFGSEDLGVTPQLLDICHEIVRIPGDFGAKQGLEISSLNVSVAAGIILHTVHNALSNPSTM